MQRLNPEADVASNAMTEPVFLRMTTVVRLTGLTRSTIYRLIADKRFPSPVRLGPRAVAWRRTDLLSWSESRPTTSH